ncbi:hypothetical protein JANAI62_16460 [Jannaschia pagri]|uniref:Uncharacterized protein n=1 Tax=Jannaschia pagri TaxID=2829797 RepID=A0ABQ4NKT9_9RHOB|nr:MULTISPECIES: hypothetical protein [unclassified Jannaschia]GIT91191.1 hypothetical protein JANAI61_16490 [Jannaschia sp. AI_61]GIT95023.1 hypothetical protein JANAI62_16460 [Jannaschia sp. AI_62]
MITPFDIWAPMIRAPFSGDVTQEITPRVLSPDIAGQTEIERTIHTEVASYGTQLGKILEALQTLSDATKTPLPDIDKLVTKVETAKTRNKDDLRADAKAALERLRAVDEDGWRALTSVREP